MKYFEALVNGFCDCNVSWKIFNILGRYWILAVTPLSEPIGILIDEVAVRIAGHSG